MYVYARTLVNSSVIKFSTSEEKIHVLRKFGAHVPLVTEVRLNTLKRMEFLLRNKMVNVAFWIS